MKIKVFALLTSMLLLQSLSLGQRVVRPHVDPHPLPPFHPSSVPSPTLTPTWTPTSPYPPSHSDGNVSSTTSDRKISPPVDVPPVYVRVSTRSPNSTMSDGIKTAAALGGRTLQPGQTRLFSALPELSNWASSRIELWRMGLDSSQKEDWQALNSQIQSQFGSSPIKVESAVKQELLGELSNGSADVVVLIAHFDGENIYLSGAFGEKISMDEISHLSRETAPDRAVVLMVCNAGGVNQDVASLAEQILQNKLARTVFASPDPVNARTVPAILDRLLLQRSSIREALGQGYIQIVRLLRRRRTDG